jgi:hypothetical protein
MHGFSLAFSLISAFVPLPPGSADAPPQPVVAQAETAPPPQPTYAPAPAPSPYAPAPTYAAPPPAVTAYGGNAPSLKGWSIWGILPYGYGATGIGAGARFMIPLPGIQPLLRGTSVRDNFALEFGADYLHWSFGYLTYGDYSVNEFLPAVGFMWNIWLNDAFVLYPKVELGYRVAWISGFPDGYNAPGYGGVFWDIGGGLMYKLSGGLTLRAEAGYAGLKGGVGWLF